MEEEVLDIRVDIRRYIDIVFRWWWIILFGPIIVAAAVYFYSVGQTPQYQAATLVQVQQTQGSVSPTLGDVSLSRTLASTYRQVIRTRPVLQAVIDELDLSISTGELYELVKVSLIAETSLISISGIDQSAQQAALISNTVASQFILLTRENQLAEIARVQTLAAAQGVKDPQGILAAQLNALFSLSVVEPAAAPPQPFSPRTTFNTLVALLAGLIGSFATAFVLAYFNDTARSPEETERRTGLPSIATILKWRSSEVGRNDIVVTSHPNSSYAEAYRQARVNVHFLSPASSSPKRYLITSSGPSIGKTTFAVNFATSLTQEGKNVILVDADFRRPGVHPYFSLPNQSGLSTLLANPDLELSEVAQPSNIEGLRIVTSGPRPPNPVELLGSYRMDRVFESLEANADVVVVDSPPVMAVTDSVVLASKTPETILLADSNTRMEALLATQKALLKSNTHVLGLVLNKFKPRRLSYGYYYYSYYRYYRSYNHDGDDPSSNSSRWSRFFKRILRR